MSVESILLKVRLHLLLGNDTLKADVVAWLEDYLQVRR